MICDFCMRHDVPLVKTYRARYHMSGLLLDGTWLDDNGEWVSCSECVTLIEANDWRTLYERAKAGIERQGGLYPILSPERFALVWQGVFGQQVKI